MRIQYLVNLKIQIVARADFGIFRNLECKVNQLAVFCNIRGADRSDTENIPVSIFQCHHDQRFTDFTFCIGELLLLIAKRCQFFVIGKLKSGIRKAGIVGDINMYVYGFARLRSDFICIKTKMSGIRFSGHIPIGCFSVFCAGCCGTNSSPRKEYRCQCTAYSILLHNAPLAPPDKNIQSE